MAKYFFDLRDNDRIFSDTEGTKLDGLDAVRQEASAALADMCGKSDRTGTPRCGGRGPRQR
jgi:hypothetical protein